MIIDLTETTYTIRRLGCTAWATGIHYGNIDRELANAGPGHVVIPESGPLAGQAVGDAHELLELADELA